MQIFGYQLKFILKADCTGLGDSLKLLGICCEGFVRSPPFSSPANAEFDGVTIAISSLLLSNPRGRQIESEREKKRDGRKLSRHLMISRRGLNKKKKKKKTDQVVGQRH